MVVHALTNCMTELAFRAGSTYRDPYNEIEVDAVFTGPGGSKIKVPAFWAGDDRWKVRFAAPSSGEWRFETICSNTDDAALHGQTGSVVASDYAGDNDLLKRGRLRISGNKSYLETADGKPFLWLGDTWWMGLCRRIGWPEGFQALAADRVDKGFSVVQMVAGPYPDMPPWDERGENEAGHPFTADYASINPDYYDMADLKIGHLVGVGLLPCLVGMWGYHLPYIGLEKVKRYWRYIVARYSAYPVAWCIAGEATMPWYMAPAEEKPGNAALQMTAWTEVTRYVREIDGFDNPITIHPGDYGRKQVEDPSVLDFEWLQTGHGDRAAVLNNAKTTTIAVNEMQPKMPVVVSEVNYEGIMGYCWQDVQRMCFWTSMLNGACGHTYGANGIWQASTEDEPYGPSPHGRCWGNTAWPEAAQLPGSAQMGYGRRLLEELPWWEMTTHNEWIDPTWDGEDVNRPTMAGIPGKLRVAFIPRIWDPPVIKGIEKGAAYDAFYMDPTSGERLEIGAVAPDADGAWQPPVPPEVHDWVLVMQA